jgi:hypothetical protein
MCLRAEIFNNRHNGRMDRESYIAPIVESYIPEASFEEKLALTQEFWTLFDALYASFVARKRFDSQAQDMVESDSRKELTSAPKP